MVSFTGNAVQLYVTPRKRVAAGDGMWEPGGELDAPERRDNGSSCKKWDSDVGNVCSMRLGDGVPQHVLPPDFDLNSLIKDDASPLWSGEEFKFQVQEPGKDIVSGLCLTDSLKQVPFVLGSDPSKYMAWELEAENVTEVGDGSDVDMAYEEFLEIMKVPVEEVTVRSDGDGTVSSLRLSCAVSHPHIDERYSNVDGRSNVHGSFLSPSSQQSLFDQVGFSGQSYSQNEFRRSTPTMVSGLPQKPGDGFFSVHSSHEDKLWRSTTSNSYGFGPMSVDQPQVVDVARSSLDTAVCGVPSRISYKIDDKRPVQSCGSVLASTCKSESIAVAPEGVDCVCRTSESNAKSLSGTTVYVDLTKDSDDEDTEMMSPLHDGHLLGKRKTELGCGYEKRKRPVIAHLPDNKMKGLASGSSHNLKQSSLEHYQAIKSYDLSSRVEAPRSLMDDLMAQSQSVGLDAGSTSSSSFTDLDGSRSLSGTQSSFYFRGGQHSSGLSVRRDELSGKIVKAIWQQTTSTDNKEASPDPGLLNVDLLKHQRIALNWMEAHEANGLPYGGILADDQGLGKTISTISLILKARPSSGKKFGETSSSLPFRPDTVNLDDDEDSRSTNDKPNCGARELSWGTRETEGATHKQMNEVKEELSQDVKVVAIKGRPAAGTLVVCPTSVLRQWGNELREKVTLAAYLSVLVYHGSGRTKDPEELAKYDVVLTTYSILSMEVPKQPLPEDNNENDEYPPDSCPWVKKQKKPKENMKKSRGNGKGRFVEGENGSVDSGPLARVNWFRVVLDEAQSIKNARTQVARAAWGLRAKRRWCLSGTPIQNAIDDLFSYFKFLRYSPWDSYKTFREKSRSQSAGTLEKDTSSCRPCYPLSCYGEQKVVAVSDLMDSLIDGKPIISLPARIVTLKQTEFSLEERTFYQDLEAESKRQYQTYAEAGTVQSNYVNILWMLLRLRQACDHPLLVKGVKPRDTKNFAVGSARALSAEQRLALLNLLENDKGICPICNDPPDDAVICICKHIFCRQCISEQLAVDNNCCPVSRCRKPLNYSLVFTLSSLKGEDSRVDMGCMEVTSENLNIEELEWKPSCKINAVIETLNSLPKVIAVVENGRVVDEISQNQEQFVQAGVLSSTVEKPSLEVMTDEKPSVPSFDRKVEDIAIQNLHYSGLNGDDRGKRSEISKREIVESTEKAIVFSQWTSMLDLLEISLRQANYNYRRLDGTMSVTAREQAISEFKNLPEVTVIIMSLKAASLGLNMVAACHVLLLDVWWNPTTEDQAIDRAHRIGQKRTVRVSRFTVKDTVEDRILALQEKKRAIVASAFGEAEARGQKNTRLSAADLDYLFQ